jgi:hypothetical protein
VILLRYSPNAQDAIYRYYDFATEYSLEKHARTLEALAEVHRQEPDNALICAMVADMHLYSCFSDVMPTRVFTGKHLNWLRKQYSWMPNASMHKNPWCGLIFSKGK